MGREGAAPDCAPTQLRRAHHPPRRPWVRVAAPPRPPPAPARRRRRDGHRTAMRGPSLLSLLLDSRTITAHHRAHLLHAEVDAPAERKAEPALDAVVREDAPPLGPERGLVVPRAQLVRARLTPSTPSMRARRVACAPRVRSRYDARAHGVCQGQEELRASRVESRESRERERAKEREREREKAGRAHSSSDANVCVWRRAPGVRPNRNRSLRRTRTATARSFGERSATILPRVRDARGRGARLERAEPRARMFEVVHEPRVVLGRRVGVICVAAAERARRRRGHLSLGARVARVGRELGLDLSLRRIVEVGPLRDEEEGKRQQSVVRRANARGGGGVARGKRRRSEDFSRSAPPHPRAFLSISIFLRDPPSRVSE